MASSVLGRTNQVFPPIWLTLRFPGQGEAIDQLVASALEAQVPIDISHQPALWGGKMRGTDATLMAIGTCEYENANDESHACDLVQAHLIETLSAIGREHIDFYFFRVQRMAEEFQLSGALQALELAKQEGHVGHIGICCDGPSFATLGAWQFHDAFEVLLVERNHFDSESYDTLAPLAKERRVGVVTKHPLNWIKGQPFVDQPELWEPSIFSKPLTPQTLAQAVIADLALDHPVVVSVNSPEQVRWVLDSFSASKGDDLPQILAPAIQFFRRRGNL